MQFAVSKLRSLVSEALEAHVEDAIEAMREEPEFANVDNFAGMKIENDEFSYGFAELQALARNMTVTRTGNRNAQEASQRDVDTIRATLEGEFGFKYTAREKVKNVRGHTSPLNGTNRYAGMGGGGSGFGSDFSGGTFTSFGGGPGAVGGGYKWDPEDPKNLSMGSKRKKQ